MPRIIHAPQLPQILPSCVSQGLLIANEEPTASVSAAVTAAIGGAFASAEPSCATALSGSGGQGSNACLANVGCAFAPVGARVPSAPVCLRVPSLKVACGGALFPCAIATFASTRSMSPSETSDSEGGAEGGT